jgi:hypothetical protein
MSDELVDLDDSEERYAFRLKSLDALPARDDPVWLLPTGEAPHTNERRKKLCDLIMETLIGPNPLDVLAA